MQRGKGATWLCLGGELDVVAAPALDAALRAAQADRSRVFVDLGELEFMDSSGLHVLLQADARARRADAQLLIARPPASVLRLFELTGALELLSILEARADAA